MKEVIEYRIELYRDYLKANNQSFTEHQLNYYYISYQNNSWFMNQMLKVKSFEDHEIKPGLL